ncbi:MAG: uncharacterized protein KVP18_003611 [Porospora cf. gigantea A]|uniref:uncharacterized protein n=1 Tax=Porospora cf. gigantea A TaxID=2853593 RepID=UPI003559847B|nr:MAG: hypothetical protein KVP18_003611 [Porospora cf. gigantea A]
MVAVLFLCLGNICRSPAAEAVFSKLLTEKDRHDVEIDSCGTGGGNPRWYQPGQFSFHEGDQADPRMRQAAKKRDIAITSRSRPLAPEDRRFDYIVCMDSANVRAVSEAAEAWGVPELAEKVVLLTDYWAAGGGEGKKPSKVPDPYYGGPDGFEHVLDLLRVCCEGLIREVL